MTIYTERPAPICPLCNNNTCAVKGKTVKGFTKYRNHCAQCHTIKYFKPYLKHRKDSCEECGFVPVHECQLDVDHIDGNKNNNDVSNLKTLCANCHRLKTYLAEDWDPRKKTGT